MASVPTPTPPAVVTKVYPSGDVLPANHLKFYLYFSKPMRGGPDLFQYLRIEDADGKAVYDPWLHDELIHLPLLLSLPHSTDDVGRRVPAMTQSCDIMPTLLDAFARAPVGATAIQSAQLERMEAALAPYWGADTATLGL